MRPVRQPVQADDIEAQGVALPGGVALQMKERGADHSALLLPTDRGEGTAKLSAAALPDFDHHQDGAVAAQDIELAAPAAQVARQLRRDRGS